MSEQKDKAPKKVDPQVNLNPDSDLPPDADAEERFNDFWKKNGPGIFGGIALAAVVVAGFQTYKYLGERKESNLQAAYAEAESSDAKLAFAKENPDHRLSGVAYLSLADERFEAGDFVTASEYYAKAGKILDEYAFAGRAQVGEGISLIYADRLEEGRVALKSALDDSGNPASVRSEAAYHLAVTYWESGQLDLVESTLDRIDEIAPSSLWSARAGNLRSQIPELAKR